MNWLLVFRQSCCIDAIIARLATCSALSRTIALRIRLQAPVKSRVGDPQDLARQRLILNGHLFDAGYFGAVIMQGLLKAQGDRVQYQQFDIARGDGFDQKAERATEAGTWFVLTGRNDEGH